MTSKSVLYSNAFIAKSGRTMSDVQKRDEQTNRQTNKKLDVFGHPGGW